MELMEIRRGLMAQMASKKRMASGEFEITKDLFTIDLTHNLGSRKIFVVAQRVNENHAEVNSTDTRYRSLMLIGFTKEAVQLDEEQTYSYKTSTPVQFSSAPSGIYPSGLYSFFPTETNPQIAATPIMEASRMVTAISDNVVRFVNTVYMMTNGRWVWRAYALD